MSGPMENKVGNAGRFLSTTGKSALRKVEDTARTIRKVGSAISSATGGAADWHLRLANHSQL